MILLFTGRMHVVVIVALIAAIHAAAELRPRIYLYPEVGLSKPYYRDKIVVNFHTHFMSEHRMKYLIQNMSTHDHVDSHT